MCCSIRENRKVDKQLCSQLHSEDVKLSDFWIVVVFEATYQNVSVAQFQIGLQYAVSII